MFDGVGAATFDAGLHLLAPRHDGDLRKRIRSRTADLAAGVDGQVAVPHPTHPHHPYRHAEARLTRWNELNQWIADGDLEGPDRAHIPAHRYRRCAHGTRGAFDHWQDPAPAVSDDGRMTTSLIAGFEALCDRQFDDIARAGVWWTGEEKLAMAAVARAAMTDRTAPQTVLGDAALEATRKVAAAASSLRQADIERWEAEGMRAEAYVELVGVVGRLAAIDTAAFGLGLDPHLPTPVPGHRSKQPCPASTMSTAGYHRRHCVPADGLHGGPRRHRTLDRRLVRAVHATGRNGRPHLRS